MRRYGRNAETIAAISNSNSASFPHDSALSFSEPFNHSATSQQPASAPSLMRSRSQISPGKYGGGASASPASSQANPRSLDFMHVDSSPTGAGSQDAVASPSLPFAPTVSRPSAEPISLKGGVRVFAYGSWQTLTPDSRHFPDGTASSASAARAASPVFEPPPLPSPTNAAHPQNPLSLSDSQTDEAESQDPFAVFDSTSPSAAVAALRVDDREHTQFARTEKFHGESRERVDEIQYLIDGLRPSQPLRARQLSALKLATLLKTPENCLLLRANGGFGPLFRAFDNCGDVPILSRVFAQIACTASKDKANGQHFTVVCAQSLLRMIAHSMGQPLADITSLEHLQGDGDSPEAENPKEQKAASKRSESDLANTGIRSRRKGASSSANSAQTAKKPTALTAAETTFTGCPSYLASVALANAASDMHFRQILSVLPAAADVIVRTMLYDFSVVAKNALLPAVTGAASALVDSFHSPSLLRSDSASSISSLPSIAVKSPLIGKNNGDSDGQFVFPAPPSRSQSGKQTPASIVRRHQLRLKAFLQVLENMTHGWDANERLLRTGFAVPIHPSSLPASSPRAADAKASSLPAPMAVDTASSERRAFVSHLLRMLAVCRLRLQTLIPETIAAARAVKSAREAFGLRGPSPHVSFISPLPLSQIKTPKAAEPSLRAPMRSSLKRRPGAAEAQTQTQSEPAAMDTSATLSPADASADMPSAGSGRTLTRSLSSPTIPLSMRTSSPAPFVDLSPGQERAKAKEVREAAVQVEKTREKQLRKELDFVTKVSLAVLRVLVNLTNRSDQGCAQVTDFVCNLRELVGPVDGEKQEKKEKKANGKEKKKSKGKGKGKRNAKKHEPESGSDTDTDIEMVDEESEQKPELPTAESAIEGILRLIVLTRHDTGPCASAEIATVGVAPANGPAAMDTSAASKPAQPAAPSLPAVFDLLTLGLGLLINCAEHHPPSCERILHASVSSPSGPISAVQLVTDMFVHSYEKQHAADAASEQQKAAEAKATEAKDGEEKKAEPEAKAKAQTQPAEKKLSAAELLAEQKELEHRVVSSYCSILLGCLIRHSPEGRSAVLSALSAANAAKSKPQDGDADMKDEKTASTSAGGQDITSIIAALKEFLVLQSDAYMLTQDALESIIAILHVLEKDPAVPRNALALTSGGPGQPSPSAGPASMLSSLSPWLTSPVSHASASPEQASPQQQPPVKPEPQPRQTQTHTPAPPASARTASVASTPTAPARKPSPAPAPAQSPRSAPSPSPSPSPPRRSRSRTPTDAPIAKPQPPPKKEAAPPTPRTPSTAASSALTRPPADVNNTRPKSADAAASRRPLAPVAPVVAPSSLQSHSAPRPTTAAQKRKPSPSPTLTFDSNDGDLFAEPPKRTPSAATASTSAAASSVSLSSTQIRSKRRRTEQPEAAEPAVVQPPSRSASATSPRVDTDMTGFSSSVKRYGKTKAGSAPQPPVASASKAANGRAVEAESDSDAEIELEVDTAKPASTSASDKRPNAAAQSAQDSDIVMFARPGRA